MFERLLYGISKEVKRCELKKAMTGVYNPPQGTSLHSLQPATGMTKGTQQKPL